MKRFVGIYLDDPEDLGQWSSGAFGLFLQMDILDFARRFYKRQGDEISVKKSKEIRKLLRTISEMQTQVLRALVPSEVIRKNFEYQEKSREKYEK